MDTDGFLQQALIYLGAGIIAVPIFTRLGAGSVLGYLVAGIAIGPWGMRLITAPQTVLQFAELGIVLLLFLVGLELNVQRVWSLRRAIFGLGTTQLVVTTLRRSPGTRVESCGWRDRRARPACARRNWGRRGNPKR